MTRCPRCQRRLPPDGQCPHHGKPTSVVDVVELVGSEHVAAPAGWELGPQLASGGTAHVYAIHRDGKQAVMKLARWRERDVHGRFRLEAEVLQSVGPPATPAYLDHGVIDERPYVIMERVDGETLAAWMSRLGDRGGLGEILAILTRLAGALAKLHDGGFVHRDLKPENIVIGPSGVRILDFGLAKPLHSTVGITQIGSVVGTLHYLAPEQLRNGSTVDHRADIYSFGVVAFEMLAGRPPFVGERKAIEYNHLVCRPPSVRESRAVPPEIEELVMSCLAKQADARPQTAAGLADSVAHALASLATLRGYGGVQADKTLGVEGLVALALVEGGDPVTVVRAVNEVHGIVVGRRGAGILTAFTSIHHDAPLSAALGACRSLMHQRCRMVVHATTALVRRSAQGKPTVYGADIERIDRWLPLAPYSGVLLTAAAAELASGAAVQQADLPGFFRESKRDRTDASDGKRTVAFVGRSSLVSGVVTRVMQRPALIGISGGAGIGKTRVLDAIVDQLRAAGHTVVALRARRRFDGDRPDDDRLMAALGGGHDLGDALAEASRRGVILAIDDVDWFSVNALRALVHRDLRMTRIVASRTPVFEAEQGDTDRIAIVLPPLSYADASVLLRELLRPAHLIPDVVIERLALRGAGSPGLLVALAQDIKRRGAIRRHHGEDWYVAVDELDTLLTSPGASWLAETALEALPIELHPIVRMCAGLGPRFCADEVTAVTGASQVAEHLPWLADHGVFVERNGWFEFVDAALQDAIYDHVLDERDLVHQRAFAYWTKHRSANLIGWLARLAYHGGPAGEPATAAVCWIALAREAVRRGEVGHADVLLARSLGGFSGTVSSSVIEATHALEPS